ncbi:hypothetical protein GLE_4866 [Lysobacter enzymogenes]|uniref:Uncharacterized protein n=1 Tax=Lysobacter enzymogenes TaxID=69 RepID=A0A0S2DPN6_LYSEN|nr:hypothetical protein GLE_4866 [Lysobacter enzymogenes]
MRRSRDGAVAARAAPTGAPAGFVADCRSDASRDREPATTTKLAPQQRRRGRGSRRSHRGSGRLRFKL